MKINKYQTEMFQAHLRGLLRRRFKTRATGDLDRELSTCEERWKALQMALGVRR